ncbi:hypothetical protein T484DRAFT_1761460 [Baffinella frigidus]|nr:hypothetical protein T484DRAFT_1761460 [Cryptophyta sp. CCMP2293]
MVVVVVLAAAGLLLMFELGLGLGLAIGSRINEPPEEKQSDAPILHTKREPLVPGKPQPRPETAPVEDGDGGVVLGRAVSPVSGG